MLADHKLHGGSVVDGTGRAAILADVAVRDGRISTIGDLRDLPARRTIDARGLVVAPGIVDLHSHADLILLGDRATQEQLLEARIRQGVTTLLVGNCGLGAAPSSDSGAAILAAVNGWMTPDGAVAGPLSIAGYLARLEAGGIALNAGTFLPHGPVRLSAMGLAAGAADASALEAMRAAVAAGLDEGAFGLTAGLIYPPGMFTPTDELVALAREAGERKRPFCCHVRGSSETLLDATRELLQIGKEAGVHVHHSHLEAVGERFWPDVARVLAHEDAARAAGQEVSHDVFVYPMAATMMSAIFPPWALEGGVPELLERLGDPATRERIRADVETRVPSWPPWQPGGWPHNLVEAVGWKGIRIASVRSAAAAPLVGRSLADVAAEQGRHPFDVVADLMIAEGGQVGQLVGEISGTDARMDTLLAIARHPAAAIISDAEDYGRGMPHPAHAGAFVRALRLAREGQLPPLEETVRRMTSYPASLVGIRDRGVLRPGAWADIVVFDPRSVGDAATWAEPRRFATGVRDVLLNGVLVVDDGTYRGGLPGRVLRARP